MGFKKLSSLIFLCFLLCVGCAKKNISAGAGDYDASEIGKVKKVVPGVIISMRPVNIHTENTENPANDNNANYPGSSTQRSRGFEYVIKLASGEIISIAQTEDTRLKVKQHILVIYGTNTRIVADESDDE